MVDGRLPLPWDGIGTATGRSDSPGSNRLCSGRVDPCEPREVYSFSFSLFDVLRSELCGVFHFQFCAVPKFAT